MNSVNFATAYIGGVLTLLAPCSAMLLPAFFAYAFDSSAKLLSRTLVFYLGLVSALIPLGATAGAIGAIFRSYVNLIALIVGILIILIGFMQIFAVKIPMSSLGRFANKKSNNTTSVLGVFLLGFSYAVAGGGCSGPILGAVLATTIVSGSAVVGVVTMIIYALGMLTPIVVLALCWDVFRVGERKFLQPKPVTFLGRKTTVGSIISGVVFIVLGVAFIFFPSLQTSLISAEHYSEIEYSVSQLTSGISNIFFVAIALVLVVLFVFLFREIHKGRKK